MVIVMLNIFRIFFFLLNQKGEKEMNRTADL